jgi:Cdc6-like AAA superfamily ATPase
MTNFATNLDASIDRTSFSLFHPKTVEFLSLKVAAHGGDARKAIAIAM